MAQPRPSLQISADVWRSFPYPGPSSLARTLGGRETDGDAVYFNAPSSSTEYSRPSLNLVKKVIQYSSYHCSTMVLLTITGPIVEALGRLDEATKTALFESSNGDNKSDEPSLADPSVGNPISHGQVIDLAKQLKSEGDGNFSLETLLRGSTVYIPPPPPKPQQVLTTSASSVVDGCSRLPIAVQRV